MQKIWRWLLTGLFVFFLCLGMIGATAFAVDEIENADQIETSDGGEELVETTVKRGIDISHHQGEIDWAKVKAAGIDFAIIRCGYGDDLKSQDDRYWKANIQGCEENGIPYGVYIYSYATSDKAVESEVQHTLRLLQEVGATPTYPIYYDLEDSTVLACGRKAIIRMANLYCSSIEAAGYQAGIYSSTYWWNNYLNDSSLDKYEKWVAHWADACGYEGYYRLWQYTSDGTVDGISGRVDMNYGYDWIDMSMATVLIENNLVYSYDGKAKTPKVVSVTMPDGVTVLTEGVDYVVVYEENVYPGTGTVKVLGRGKYAGVIKSNFTIQAPTVSAQQNVTSDLCAKDAMEIRWSSQIVPGATVRYKVEQKKKDGKWEVLKAKTKDTSYKTTGLEAGTQYAFRVTPFVIVDGQEYYGASKTSAYVYTLAQSKLKSVKKASKKKITLTWKNIAGESGYEIAQSVKKGKNYKVVKAAKVNVKSTKLKVARGKNFYYKVRAYKLVNGKKVYGQWSAPMKYKLM